MPWPQRAPNLKKLALAKNWQKEKDEGIDGLNHKFRI
jgi:hypothetical protein